MPPAIRVENLSKSYRIHHAGQKAPYRTLRESLVEAARAPWRRRPGDESRTEEFWALKGVEFEVQPGEVVGIIGRNGAGKSTLLKILSRITEPTNGRVGLRGRVGSLLEVGTGFHPELTGRENIYLNGSILGMSRREINKKFAEIVEFAEIERFLDTPVKRYSSGMYVRLAFSVAAHLDPEIMIIDEVLAVGDFSFQKKCLGKMGEVSRSGRTILFVSHNIAAIEALCERCLLLSFGRLESEGPTEEILAEYVKSDVANPFGRLDLTAHPGRSGASTAIMSEVVLGDGVDEPVSSIRMGSHLSVRVSYDLEGRAIRPVLGLVFRTALGSAVFGVNNRFIYDKSVDNYSSYGNITCNINNIPLMPGIYSIDMFFGDYHHDLDIIHNAILFEVVESDVFGTGCIPPHMAGPVFWPATWESSHSTVPVP
jgi:lipopolysaccharide transport system ATP-binding protein